MPAIVTSLAPLTLCVGGPVIIWVHPKSGLVNDIIQNYTNTVATVICAFVAHTNTKVLHDNEELDLTGIFKTAVL